MPVLGYLLYGERPIYELELAYSVLSAQRWLRDDPRDVKIALITDRPALDLALPVERVAIDAGELADWTRGGSYHHRTKVLALGKLLDHFAAPVALVDTDTTFSAHPSELFARIGPGASLMHAYDSRLGEDPLWPPLLAQVGAGREIAGVMVAPTSEMFNSGVIGLHPDDRGRLTHVLEVLDALYAMAPIFNIEQFALTAVLDKETRLSVCPDVVRHYWGLEREFVHVAAARLVRDFRARGWGALADFPAAPVGFPGKRLRHKIASFALGLARRWDPDYRFAYLAYLSGLSCRDRDTANAWVATAGRALDASLRRDERARADRLGRARHDFARLAEPQLGALGWLRPEVKDTWRALWRMAPG